jgi:hypothetical protein
MTCKVIIVTSIPPLKSPVMISGVPTLARAQAWGDKHGYPVVYYWRRMERVYTEKEPGIIPVELSAKKDEE